MSLLLAARLARRELRGGLGEFRIFLACLAIGVAAIAAVGSVRSGIEAGLAREGAVLLGGDAQMEFTYRFATDDELAWMVEQANEVSEVVDFRSMAVVERNGQVERGLTQVKAVDEAHPLKGTVLLDPEISLAVALAGKDDLPGAVMEQVLIDRLGLRTGDRIRLGLQEFVLTARIVSEPDSAGGGFGLGPRTIVATRALGGSGLLVPGTLYSTKYRLVFPADTDMTRMSQTARRTFESSGMRWSDARNGAPGLAEFIDRLGAFLILVGLSGLAVGGVGVFSAVRSYLESKTSVIATLRTIGADRRIIYWTYFLQIGALALCGVALGTVLGGTVPFLAAPLIESRMPVPLEFAVYPAPLAEAALYGMLTALIFVLWPLARSKTVRAAVLFRDSWSSLPPLPGVRDLCAVFGTVVLLVGSAAWFSGSVWLTYWTAGGIAFALSLLALVALGIQSAARLASGLVRGWPALRWAVSAIGGPREGVMSAVLSLGLGLSVLAAVGQIDGNLRLQIAGDLPEIAPSYFVVDIQKEQMAGFGEQLASNPAVRKVETAPMLRGVITRINNRPARDVAGEHWVLQGDRGVTYSAVPSPDTTVTEGEWWEPEYSGPPLISFAAEEGEEMGLRLGDRLTVNVLGRDIIATIANFREVDFSTAGIGFVMSMNPGAIADAPHSFIATIYAREEAEAAILRDLANAYPNITAIRVRDVINRVSELLSGISTATRYGAAVTLLTGFFVLIGVAAAGVGSRIYEAGVLKTLGAPRSLILASFAIRSAILGTAAGGVALLVGIGGGWAVCRFVLEFDFEVIWGVALVVVVGGISGTLLSGLFYVWQPLAARPARVLRAVE